MWAVYFGLGKRSEATAATTGRTTARTDSSARASLSLGCPAGYCVHAWSKWRASLAVILSIRGSLTGVICSTFLPLFLARVCCQPPSTRCLSHSFRPQARQRSECRRYSHEYKPQLFARVSCMSTASSSSSYGTNFIVDNYWGFLSVLVLFVSFSHCDLLRGKYFVPDTRTRIYCCTSIFTPLVSIPGGKEGAADSRASSMRQERFLFFCMYPWYSMAANMVRLGAGTAVARSSGGKRIVVEVSATLKCVRVLLCCLEKPLHDQCNRVNGLTGSIFCCCYVCSLPTQSFHERTALCT